MTKYEAVAQAIKTDIENGVYTEGQAIPTEELLAAQYDVSRQTIRKALALLVEDDLIIKRQGSGSVVRPKRLNPRTGKIAVVATYISDYIFPSQLRAVDEVLSENKYTAVLSATRNRVCNERAILEEILKNPVDGILIEGTKSAMPNPNFDLYEKLIGMGIPVVFFNGYYPTLSARIPSARTIRRAAPNLCGILLTAATRKSQGISRAMISRVISGIRALFQSCSAAD